VDKGEDNMATERASTNATLILGLLVGGLLGLGGWFVQGSPLWIGAGLIVGLLGGMLGARGGQAEGPPNQRGP
jgi:hypothetical protein